MRIGRGRRRQVAVEARLLLVVERAVEGRERGLDRVEGRKRGVDPLLHRLEPRRRRGALGLVAADALRDGVERPVVELGPLLAAAANELLDHGAEGAAAGAAERGIAAFGVAPARPILALA